eukprot:g7476.t1
MQHKVESTVLLSDAQVNFRHLIEGSKKLGIPAPPSQSLGKPWLHASKEAVAVLDELLMAVEIWDTLQVEMNQELHADHIAEVTLERVELLSHEILHELEHVMNLSIPMARNVSATAFALNMASHQAELASTVVEYSLLVYSGHEAEENWRSLNRSIKVFESNRWSLLEGMPGNHPNRERRQNMLLEKLADTLKLAIYGSFTPPVPAPMTQWHFEELIKLEPWVQEMQRLAGSPMPQNLQMVDAGDHLMEDVLTLQEEYLKEALALRPSWPGQRMDLAVQQMGLARKVFKEAVLFSYDLRSNDKQLQAAIGMFRDNHARLKDGGEAIPAIMLPERQDCVSMVSE